MFKKIIGSALLAITIQSVAFAADFTGTHKSKVENTLGIVWSAVEAKESDDPNDYASPEIFANFRAIKAKGLKENWVYRSSNPFNIYGNKARHSYADKLSMQAGINTEIDLADTDKDMAKYVKNAGVRKKYVYGLYYDGNFFNVHLGGNGLYSRDWPKIAEAFRFMMNNEGPYLVHCRIGKDRAGFFSMLCASLAGADLNDIRADYMQTYCNYYHIKPNSYEYSIIQKFQCDKIIYYMAHPEYAADKQRVPDQINVYEIVPEQAAKEFFRTALEFTDEEIEFLQSKLKDDRSVKMRTLEDAIAHF